MAARSPLALRALRELISHCSNSGCPLFEQARQSNRQEIVHSIAEADALTSELTDLLIEKVYVFPNNRIEIVYKVHDLFE